jgi:PfaD family protein
MSIGFWQPTTTRACFSREELAIVPAYIRENAWVIQDPSSGCPGVGIGGELSAGGYPVLAVLPPLYPEWLGDQSFLRTHNVRFPYAIGAMAHAIASASLVIAAAKARMLAFYGAGGVHPTKVEQAVVEIRQAVEAEGLSWGANLIHSPHDPELENIVADMYLRHGVRRVDASAYLRITPAVVRYACTGLRTDPAGNIVRVNHLFAKLSRPEVAIQFLSPAPAKVLSGLLEQKLLTDEEARLAQHVPLAEDITVEADSGGHTDNRPLVALFPTIRALRDQLVAKHGYARTVRIGCGGGIGTPDAMAAAFGLGASFVLTGSINQATVEAGTSDTVKEMLAQADIADVIMAPSPDMFEMGVRVQVLRKGTMFAGRASQLYDLYSRHNSIEEIPAPTREKVEKDIFREPLDQVWQSTAKFFEQRDPKQLAKANADPKFKMALVFRSYVGQSSHWAVRGDASRKLDYQIWCGPAMGAFNNWTRGSFLAEPPNRTVVQVGLNLLEGAAVVTRAQQLRSYGLPMPDAAFDYRPRPLQ